MSPSTASGGIPTRSAGVPPLAVASRGVILAHKSDRRAQPTVAMVGHVFTGQVGPGRLPSRLGWAALALGRAYVTYS